jgi:hypothetical protein
MRILEKQETGAGGEIQLTDAMLQLIGRQPSTASLLKANATIAATRPASSRPTSHSRWRTRRSACQCARRDQVASHLVKGRKVDFDRFARAESVERPQVVIAAADTWACAFSFRVATLPCRWSRIQQLGGSTSNIDTDCQKGRNKAMSKWIHVMQKF